MPIVVALKYIKKIMSDSHLLTRDVMDYFYYVRRVVSLFRKSNPNAKKMQSRLAHRYITTSDIEHTDSLGKFSKIEIQNILFKVTKSDQKIYI